MYFIKNNLWIIFVFVLFILFGVVYINKTFIDVIFLDGLMPVHMVKKYFEGNLSFFDINMTWGEHRLIGYSLIFLFNAIFFSLNMKIEPFIFLLSYFLIGLILYFIYKNFLNNVFKNKFKWWMDLSFIPMLFLVFSLVHPPAMLMTTQFVIGTLFFILIIKFFDRLCLDSKKWLDLFWFFILIFIYLVFFSGANFGGMILGFFVCGFFKTFLFEKKKPTSFWYLSILFTLLLVVLYFVFTRVDSLDGVGLIEKIIIYFFKFKESFLSILAGISGTTLDIHTFEELFGGKDIFVLINGSVLFLLGLYSVYKYLFLKMYKFTYIPILLICYSIGHIIITKLGRLDGGWMWPMNEWYSFHLYFYLIGILWILLYDVFVKYTQLSIKSFKNLFKNYFWTLIIFIFSLFWIFSFQMISNLAQWRRAPYVKKWLETKREAILFPTDKSLESLLWDKENSLKAIETLKKYKLSVFREGGYLDKQNGIIKLSGWNSDGWIGKDAKIMVTDSKEGVLSLNLYIPANIFGGIYKNSITLQIMNGENVLGQQKFLEGSFNNGPIEVVFNIPKETGLNLDLKLDKSFIPTEYNLGKDSRNLGIIINGIKVK